MTLSIGIGATTAICSIVSTVLLEPLPLADGDRLVQIVENGRPRNLPVVSYREYLEWQPRTTTLSELAAAGFHSQIITPAPAGLVRVTGGFVSPNYFEVLGVRPLLGRTLASSDAAHPDVMVLSYYSWRRHFAADPGAIGRVVAFRAEPSRAGRSPWSASCLRVWRPSARRPSSTRRSGADGVAVWASTYDEPRTALLMLQDRLAEHVVSALRIELAASDWARLHVRYTNNPDAYDRYLRGRSLLLNYTEANMRSAIQQFEQALQLDQNYALAHAGIATASAWFSVRYAHQAEENQWAKRAHDEATRALALDGSLPEAHLASASAAGTPFGGYDWKALLAGATNALALDPSLEMAHLARMRAYYHLGLFEAAAREGREAVRLNPAHSVEFDRLEVALLLFRGEFAKAVEKAQSLHQRTDAPAAPQYFGLALYYTGGVDRGRAMLESIKRGTTPDLRAQASLASIEAASGRRTEARARLARILAASELDHHVAYGVGAAFAQLGDGAAALEWLERAADTGFPCYPWFERDPLLNPVRANPRFVALLARLRTADEAARRLQF